ncbi:MAG: helix-turn-helix domain-containing protein [Prevotella sp.]|nr:helix-turn-helix domain-containing protein [Prevotella sp.]
MKRKVLTLIIAFLLLTNGFAQTGRHFDADKQLSSSFTSQVYLDKDGFVWVATRNGLNRYDGYQFQQIRKERAQQQGMASNYVNCMTQDHSGLYYIGMYGALQTYDGVRFQDVEVRDLQGNTTPCYITCFLVRDDGSLLAGTSGLGLLRLNDRSHARQLDGPLHDIETVQALAEDSRHHVWIATGSRGLIDYDGKTAQHHLTDAARYGNLLCLCTDRQGTLYVGTSQAGVLRRDSRTGAFEQLTAIGNRHVSALYCRQDGQLMIGFDGEGTAVYDPLTGKADDNPYFSSEVDLKKSKVYSIAEDRSGNIWLGLLQKGIYMQPKKITAFQNMGQKLSRQNRIGQACVISTIIDSKGRCWVGTDKDGLYCMDYEQRLLHHFKENFPSSVMSLAEDGEGRIWVGSYGEGFGYVDASGRGYHKFGQYTKASGFSIVPDRDGQLWVATMGQGLLRIDPATERVKAYTQQRGAAEDRSVNSIVNDYISKITLSPDGKRLYVASTMGLCCLDIDKESWTNTLGRNCLEYGKPIRIAKEYDGLLWIGTNDGLYSYDLKYKTTQKLTAEKGLTDNGIAAIEHDLQGRLWISTDHGLCCYNPKTGLTENYFVDDGLQSNEFSDGASCCIDRGGRVVMLFGGAGGITWFSPEQVRQPQWDAEVCLVNFMVDNRPVNSGSLSGRYQICDTTVIAARHFELSPDDDTFVVQFSTLTYETPDHISYLYSINGEPFARLQPGSNEITLTQLRPGTYHFRVKAERNNQETPLREFTVTVHAPWYRTPWAYLLYALLAGGAVALYLRSMQRKAQDRLRLQEHIHAEEMGEAKLRFFMNISHEIRTPMTLILTPLLSLIKNEEDLQRRSIYETIRRNAERILGLINQMMDLRKIDKGQMQMRMAETDLVAFVGDIHSLFGHQAKAKGIALSFTSDTEELPVWIDRKNFDKVIVNILSNAFKFTPTGGKIDIRLTHDDSQAVITIGDNGEKIPEDKIGKIFERFYQTASTVNDNHVGTGIGLDLTRSLVELHHGTISAHNLEEGCEFVVAIPLGSAHLMPEEMADSGELAANEENGGETEELMAQEEELLLQPAVGNGNGKPKLVIAEDDSEIREYLSTELGKTYEVVAVGNGKEGLAAALHTLPDLVVSDVMMPEMDGTTLCSKLKTNPNTSHIPVVLLTAKSRDEDKIEGLFTGADAYIVKPFNMDILCRTIVNLINSHRMLRLKYERNDKLEEKVDEIKIKSPDEKLLERVMTSVNRHLSDSDLSIDMVADEVGISRVHLHRKMKELTGQTPHDFIRNIRLKRAANLLATQSMNVTEVMYACGFSNAASFSIIFKKFYGVSPREYTKEHARR